MINETAFRSSRSSPGGYGRLHTAIKAGRASSGIALMSHAVVGYPSVEHNEKSIAALVAAGANLMELQFPFSDPLADGPILTRANQQAVNSGITVDDCFALASKVATLYPDTAFVAMTYLNLISRNGMRNFIKRAAAAGISGLIVPDLPPEESEEFSAECTAYGLGTVFLVTPTTSPERTAWIGSLTTGFIYCVGRPGVSGDDTVFDDEMLKFIDGVKSNTDLPVGVGFGVRTLADIDCLRNVADMAIICTEIVRRVDVDGIEDAANYLASLRDEVVR